MIINAEVVLQLDAAFGMSAVRGLVITI